MVLLRLPNSLVAIQTAQATEFVQPAAILPSPVHATAFGRSRGDGRNMA